MRAGWSILVLFAATLPGFAQPPNPVVVINTNQGTIKAELFPDKAPLTVKNFLQYADDRYYDGTIFHRVIPNFMIQGGGLTPGLKEKKGARPPVKLEINNLSHQRGCLAMARAADPHSATSQFFINVVDLPHLDQIKPGYVVFGKVTSGMDVVDKIKKVAIGDQGGHQNVPLRDVVILSVHRASRFSLDVSGTGAFPRHKVFTLAARVEHPIAGQALTLELPAGLERVEGREIQPVAAGQETNQSLVIWRVRGVRPGEHACVVRSSTGIVQTLLVHIH